MKNNEKQAVIITGCDSGIGKALCEILTEQGFPVIASFLEHNPFEQSSSLYTKKMNITKTDQIDSFVFFIKETCSREGLKCACLVNNAGIAKGGPVENLPLDIFREVFEVNFFGLVALTAKLIGLLEKDRGKIIIIGSMAGRIALPFLSPYCAAKFALEGFADSLRRELAPLGIRTILLEPGGVATPIWSKAKKQDISFIDERYKTSMGAFEKNFIDPSAAAMSPRKAAVQIYKIISRKKNKTRYIIADNKFFTWLPLLLPTAVFDRVVKKMFSMDYGLKRKD